ncbi:oxidoreductase-like domain-containing protein [Pseudoalteromonas ostreae]|uniref:oxidoreductase-like domain-containing protein n=1 Tax=Pseudoalteromonas ostreae TaxID=2774154 RepID=UPI001B36B54B|nr:oxidoreductase-like domain-containing protein [Pseudoalteromonas ostreae]
MNKIPQHTADISNRVDDSKPSRPAADQCCGGGSCCPCVWDEYREALKTWRQQNPELSDHL